jgi:hypothetical protein
VTEALLLAATVAGAVWMSRPGEWHPLSLVVLLLALAVLGQWLSVETSGGQLSASLVAIVLSMGLLGPAAAAACGVAAMILTSTVRRLPPAQWLNNLSAFAAVPFAGGLMVRAIVDGDHGLHSQHLAQSTVFGLIVLGVFVVTIGLNFVLFAVDVHLDDGRSVRRLVSELFLPLLPGTLATGVLATILTVAYRSVGLPMLLGSIVALLILRHLTVALLRSEERAEQLETRTIQLVGLQVGVLRTLVRALGKRDETTGRHAAAVSAYAKALAAELGCSEAEQDVVHSAGLLHEIGKFTWPDRILHADVVEAQDLAIVKNHPQEGAILVGALDGYGPVADAILYHHERIDGKGYPAGLIANEIPLGSRILAICSTYDAMIGRDSYRTPMTPEEAMDELRSGAKNGQFERELVETFITLLEREGQTFAQNGDFETALEFERRVGKLAQPRATEPKTPARPPRSRRLGRDRRSGVWSLAQRPHNKG